MSDCDACCSHGGCCTLPAGHEGLHGSGGSGGKIYCTWDDASGVSRAEADRILIGKRGAYGEAIAAVRNAIEEAIGND
jgi:hypothetical protein